MKVLVVVEDDPDMQVLVEMILSDDPRLDLSGSARSAEEALAAARALQPNLIVPTARRLLGLATSS